jgi:hypothetical protein
MEGDDELGPKGRGILDGGLLEDVGWDAQVGEVQLPRPGRVRQRQHAHHGHPEHNTNINGCVKMRIRAGQGAETSVVDPDPLIHASDLWIRIRILIFPSKNLFKKRVFCVYIYFLKVLLHNFSKIKS